VFFIGIVKMVEELQATVAEYDNRLRELRLVPQLSYGRTLRKDGAPNRMFLTCLFIRQELAVQFLKGVGLIPRKMQCKRCQGEMMWYVDQHRKDGFRWQVL
jgi:hypothetical protein